MKRMDLHNFCVSLVCEPSAVTQLLVEENMCPVEESWNTSIDKPAPHSAKGKEISPQYTLLTDESVQKQTWKLE